MINKITNFIFKIFGSVQCTECGSYITRWVAGGRSQATKNREIFVKTMDFVKCCNCDSTMVILIEERNKFNKRLDENKK